jgi:copper homeostasis protein
MRTPALEVIATSLHDAIEAERGGATRLELVRELDRGGLTPPLQLVRDVVAAVQIPVRVMVREREAYGLEGPEELRQLRRSARELGALGIDGLVLGFVRGRSADLETTMEVLAAAPSVPATFHHAFDDLSDPIEAVAALKSCGRIDHVLTRGRDTTPEYRAAWLRTLACAARPEISVMVGGGVDASVIRALRGEPSIDAFHVGRAARVPASAAGSVSAAKVRALREALHSELRTLTKPSRIHSSESL